ncbi:MAG TPA: hypothetical protein VFY06_15005 [Verrucomicrobiae bacterium]|nr:hypothetical protein [Verrucomicrobiae bacterium]
MLELFEVNPPLNVQETEYQRLLGFPRNHVLSGRARELAGAARRWYSENGKPWIYARQLDSLELADEKLRVGGTEFSSKQLHDQFAEAQAEKAVLVAVSAGGECEEHARRLWQESKPDEYFFMEMFGSAVVEHLVTIASGKICSWADANGSAALPHYSPGYSGWDVSDQITLWNLIRQYGASHFNGRLEVLETGMLRPKKSLLAIFGITRDLEKARSLAKLVPCENCSLPDCRYRRAPYLHAPPQIEDVRALLSNAFDELNRQNGTSVCSSDAKYSVNPRALEKWARERLQLEATNNGSVEAKFRYEGTTCSNTGRALEFDYYVKLAPRENDYRILEMHCAPAPGDTGHQFQCEYLNNAESLMRSIAHEKPLLGRPLNDVLDWKREYNPSGCFCDLSRREHKWGLVFEVIHFALVQRDKGRWTTGNHFEMIGNSL